ncbi:MAG: hypothetical protein ACWGN1_06550 [Desulfobulbales bacterium]
MPLGVIYRNEQKTVFEDQFEITREHTLVGSEFDAEAFGSVVDSYAV